MSTLVLPNPADAETSHNNKQPISLGTLFTIGYQGLSIDKFIDTLLTHKISALIDVRKNPISRKPGFSKTRFTEHLGKAGIAYYHLPELGISSALRHDLNTPEIYEKLFVLYQTEILPFQFASLETIKLILKNHESVALTCFEADPAFCHRHKIIEHLQKDFSFPRPQFYHIYRTV